MAVIITELLDGFEWEYEEGEVPDYDYFVNE